MSVHKYGHVVARLFRKYFLEGQRLADAHEITEDNQSPQFTELEEELLGRYRKYTAVAIPAVILQVLWWSLAFTHDFFALFPDRYYMSITMVFGALIAGATSEGGGAVAFPVMTLVFSIAPDVARDFSIVIQSIGMGCATFAIIFMRIQVEWHSIVFCTSGGAVGLVLGFNYLVNILTAPMKKMFFVSLSCAFAVGLLLLNREKKRKTFDYIQNFCLWKMIVLFSVGVLGGLFTSFSGTGVDLYSFACLTLLFHVSEKVATPTSVVIMAFISLTGLFYKTALDMKVSIESLEFVAVCAPIVGVCCPLGACVASHFHRQVFAFFIYVLEFGGLVTAFAVVRPGLYLALASVAILAVGSLVFYAFSQLGYVLHRYEMRHITHNQKSIEDTTNDDCDVTKQPI